MSNFKAKMHKIRFPLGIRPRPGWGSLQRSPGSLVGPTATSKARAEEEGEGKVTGEGRNGRMQAAYYFDLQPPLGRKSKRACAMCKRDDTAVASD